MSRRFQSGVITANHLIDGDVVYLSAAGQWVRDLRDAEMIDDPADADLRVLEAASDQSVVGVYFAEMRAGPNGPEPSHFREAFRARGPSNRAHGKQEHAA